MKLSKTTRSILPALLTALGLTALPAFAEGGWWDTSWAHRQPVTIDPAADTALTEGTGPVTVLVRLHEGNFAFADAGSDGSDLRFVSEDGKTVYPHQVEKYDSLINEAFVWVKLPAVQPGSKTTLFAYYGNPAPKTAGKPTEAYDADSALVWHFSGQTGQPSDATSNGSDAGSPGTFSEGALIGGGLRLLGAEPVVIKENAALAWNGAMTVSLWLRPTAVTASNVVLSRGEGADRFRLLLDHGVPIVEMGGVKSSGGEPLAAGTWANIAVTAEAGSVKVFVDGKSYGTAQAALPALQGPLTLGGPAGGGATPFAGEIDELEISKVARSAGWVRFSATSQGTGDAAARLVTVGAAEAAGAKAGGKGESEVMQQIGLFGDIAHNMKFDGWIAIGLCVIMIFVGWTVAVRKFIYLNSIQKGSKEFLRQWKLLSSDLTAIDHADINSVSSFGGSADAKTQQLVQKSPLYEIYHIGSEEIRHRLGRDKERTNGLSGRSIQAIRAALDGGLVHATHKLTQGLVFLTISIAGGPYVGLLGTVVGVMITFAIIAKSGEVDVNSIAPGIASALLATVAGLVVAIPALFMYSYLNSKIKEATSGMQVFIDEFVSKMAEFYPPTGEVSPYAPTHNDKAA
jgi:biopolymer transport protein ExbB